VTKHKVGEPGFFTDDQTSFKTGHAALHIDGSFRLSTFAADAPTLNYAIPAGTTIPSRGYVIIARNATKAAFQTFWGRTLASNVIYINSGDTMPQINGSETYTLFNAAGSAVEGATVAMDTSGGSSFQRATCGAPGTLTWIRGGGEPVNTEFRDDRFTAAFDRKQDSAPVFTVAYVVRAVSPGRYVLPQAIVEDMYRPDRFGRTATGKVEITAGK